MRASRSEDERGCLRAGAFDGVLTQKNRSDLRKHTHILSLSSLLIPNGGYKNSRSGPSSRSKFTHPTLRTHRCNASLSNPAAVNVAAAAAAAAGGGGLAALTVSDLLIGSAPLAGAFPLLTESAIGGAGVSGFTPCSAVEEDSCAPLIASPESASGVALVLAVVALVPAAAVELSDMV